MFGRSMLQLVEPTGSMNAGQDIDVKKEFHAIGLAAQHIGVTMYAGTLEAFNSGTLQAFNVGTILQYLAVIAAIYLFVVNRTEWRTNILTSLLVPYVALNLPHFLFKWFRGEIGLWIAFIAVVLMLFFPAHFPEEAHLPANLVLLLVTAPGIIVGFRFHWVGIIVSVLIGFYLAYEHISKSGGCKAAFAERGVPITIGIVLLFVAPLWQLIFSII